MPPPVPAVIIQVMVPAETAGVAFSADPVSGRRGLALVAAVKGLGESLVSGESTGDSYQVDRSGNIVHRNLGGQAGLTDHAIKDIVSLARRAEHVFGQPQDIEWAMTGTALHILQSRPITSLAALPDPDGAWQLWDNSNIAESYSGITTPLTFSFAREIYEEVYRQFVKILNVPAHRIEANRDVFSRMLGLIQGRVYYNLLSWYRVLAMLPGFAVNRKFMEQMMGVKEGLPDEALPIVVGETRSPRLRDYVEIAGTVGALIANHVMLPKKIEDFYKRLDAALRHGDPALEDMRPDELATSYRHLQKQLLTRWDAPLINDFFAMIYFGVSRKLVDAWCGDPDGTLQNDLIVCQGGMISAEPAKRILHMASMARANPALLSALESDSPTPSLAKEFPEFFKTFREYLEKFGDRCLEELKLESATLHDDPQMVLHSIARLARQPAQAGFDTGKVSADATARVAKALHGHPIRRRIFDFVIWQTRQRVLNRENLRFERTRVFGRVRRIFLELGRRFHAMRVLDDPRDIFYLETEEALGFVEGTGVTTQLGELAALRKSEFEQWKATSPDGRFETRGVVQAAGTYKNSAPKNSPALKGEERKGIGCCPGIIRGRARVILDPRHAVMEPGEILVAPRTDPGWIMLFPSAAGLLVEHGSLLSHSAIVAREMGIPAVVSIPDLTAWLQSGDEMELDGATGRVTRLTSSSNAK
jgi:pyruvate,water dikinase